MTRKHQTGSGAAGIIVIVLILAVLGYIGWRVWDANNHRNGAQSNTNVSAQNIFKVADLGVEFELKDGITVLDNYKVDDTLNEPHRLIRGFSTQQLVNKGAEEASGGTNSCALTGNPSTSFVLLDVFVYDSAQDALTADTQNGGQLTASDIDLEHGYITINGKVFAVQQAPKDTTCTTTDSGHQLERQQFNLLKESLMTLRANE